MGACNWNRGRIDPLEKIPSSTPYHAKFARSRSNSKAVCRGSKKIWEHLGPAPWDKKHAWPSKKQPSPFHYHAIFGRSRWNYMGIDRGSQNIWKCWVPTPGMGCGWPPRNTPHVLTCLIWLFQLKQYKYGIWQKVGSLVSCLSRSLRIIRTNRLISYQWLTISDPH